jgi:glycosyltransferase XagB
MAVAGLAVLVAIASALAFRASLLVVMITWLSAIPTLSMIVFECAALREFGRDHKFKITVLDYIRLVVGTPFYQLLLAFGAARALIKFRKGDFRWEKTSHAGAHLRMIEADA